MERPSEEKSTSRRVSLLDIEGFHVLSKRYFGDAGDVRKWWTDFLDCVPDWLLRSGNALYLGLLHDIPRVTPSEQFRYDCCITVPEPFAGTDPELARHGLSLMTTHPGQYGCLEFRGPHTMVEPAYTAITAHWAPWNGLLVVDQPAIELHEIPRPLQDRNDLSFTILVPVE